MARGSGHLNLETGVYMIQNSVDGKVYVGSASQDIARRVGSHRRSLAEGTHVNRYLQRAFDKYGAGVFSWRVLEFCEPNDCLAVEQKWIERLRSYMPDNGYNLCRVANNQRGLIRSEESRRKISEANRRRFSCPVARAKLAEGARNYWAKPEARAAIAEKSRGRVKSPEECKKLSRAAVKRYQDPAQRARWSEIAKRQWADPQFRRKMAEAMARRYGRPLPPLEEV